MPRFFRVTCSSDWPERVAGSRSMCDTFWLLRLRASDAEFVRCDPAPADGAVSASRVTCPLLAAKLD
jgi:hypothetical protein